MGTRMRARLVATGALIVGLGWPLFQFAAQSGNEERLAAQTARGQLRTGVFAGPVIGLKYETPTGSGVTNEKGQFQYRGGEEVTFSVGGVVLGSATGADRVNVAQLLPWSFGDINKLHDPRLTNRARLLQTLDQDGNVENGVTLAPQAHEVVGSRLINFGQSEEAFSHDNQVDRLLAELNWTKGVFTAGIPRYLRTPEEARNEVRRNIRGIIKTTDVRIPLRDGAFVYADVFRPAQDGKYPVVMTYSVYGKAFAPRAERECICNPTDAQRKEELEDRYFSGNPDALHYENHEAPNTADWVPKGYVVIRADGRGTCASPGVIDPLSFQEAKDFYDAIEWAGVQPWSNGNVGTWGASYDAMDQHNVASLQPPHLKAMIPIGTDIVTFEDSLFNGGILNAEMWTEWAHDPARGGVFSGGTVCGEPKYKDFMAIAKAHPFYDPALYGPQGSSWITPDMSKVTVPQLITMPTRHGSHIHQRGSSEAFILSATPVKNKKLKIVGGDWMADAYASTAEQIAFFDYWLKGVKNGIMDEPPVRAFIRTGKGAGYWQAENEWPIARTKYTKFYLDASPSTWAGDGRRRDFLRLSPTAPSAEKSKSYSAEVGAASVYRPPPERLRTLPQGRGSACWATGVSFVTDPMPEDMVLAGYMKLGLWVSSTSSDMDIFAGVRVIDDQNREVDYSGPPDLRDPTNVHAVGLGYLKVSHRKLDPQQSTDWRPIHTHTEADYAPVRKDEIVPVEVMVVPNTALVKKGYRIRLDLQPYDGCGLTRHWYDPTYHTGADNAVYTGPKHLSYLQLPVIPAAGAVGSTAAK